MEIRINEQQGKLYAGALPKGAKIIGTVARNSTDKGALVKLPNGKFVQINAGVIRTLPLHEIGIPE